MENKQQGIEELEKKYRTLERKYSRLNKKYKRIYGAWYEIENSASWKLTRPLRKCLDKNKNRIKKNRFTNIAYKGLTTIKNDGFSNAKQKMNIYLERRKKIKEFYEKTGLYFSPSDDNQEFCPYESNYQENIDFSKGDNETNIKTLAFYLPQFHRIKENDEWWGEGFTEWTNTKKAKSRFEGHYQPRTPHKNIGYYDLSKVETLKHQVELAKQHGIYGFCFYYYWFSGRRIMEKPVDMLLAHPEIDTNFCLCWANENFTRAWDGLNKEVLLGQEYSEEDKRNFILDMKKYIDDKRYVRVNGKPLVIVYNPGQIPDIEDTFAKWRETAQECGIGDILIWTCQTANNTAKSLEIEKIVDAEVEFPPHNMWHDILGVRDLDLNGKAANVYNYRKLVQLLEKQYELRKDEKKVLPLHRTCMMAWDNAARRADNWTTFYGYSLESFYKWVSLMVEETENDFAPEEQIMFVNAWNEWAEGTYLEPDEEYGYANINTFSKALYKIPFERIRVLMGKDSSVNQLSKVDEAKIAVQIHLFYTDTIDEIIKELNKIPYKYDCYISTDTEEKKLFIEEVFGKASTASRVIVEIFDNRGRDVAPFIIQMSRRIEQYEYLCHIHSKKTKTNDYGTYWRKYLYKNLFGSTENIADIFSIFEERKDIGIIYPEAFPIVSKQAVWGGNEYECENLIDELELDVELETRPVFPVGNMFWARTDAVKKIFQYEWTQEDFPEEKGQVNITLGHQIERIWCYLAFDAGYTYQTTYSSIQNANDYPSKKRIGVFVHYDKNNIISNEDVIYLKACSKFIDNFIFVTNSALENTELDKIRQYVQKVIIRENEGYDFGAWRDAIFEMDFNKLADYDEMVLLNNSCYLVRDNFKDIFTEMDK
ncbi:MAG: glycoside hydrolase family 99-like domain-containing protein, partial [Eubacterium sp.]|nr:glycoside hydrolase family 99-like domain-containing protein [Eubacterium sp.]